MKTKIEGFVEKWLGKQPTIAGHFVTELQEVIAEAIAEHEAEQWKPYPENVPENPGNYLIQIGINNIKIDKWYYHGGNPDWVEFPVIAYRNLPAAYQKGGEG